MRLACSTSEPPSGSSLYERQFLMLTNQVEARATLARSQIHGDDEALNVLAAAEDEPVENEHSVLGLAELLLKYPLHVDALTRETHAQAELIPRFLAIALVSFSVFALALSLVLSHANTSALPTFLAAHWTNSSAGSALGLWMAYTLGLIGATGVCLPSFYFYSLLAGVRISMLQVTANVLKAKACTALMLLGILPIYVAVVLGLFVFQAPLPWVRNAVSLGLALPFLAGVWGVWGLYRGFLGLADTLPPERRCARTCFLRRLTVSMAACYSAVTPLMIYSLWTYFADRLA